MLEDMLRFVAGFVILAVLSLVFRTVKENAQAEMDSRAGGYIAAFMTTLIVTLALSYLGARL